MVLLDFLNIFLFIVFVFIIIISYLLYKEHIHFTKKYTNFSYLIDENKKTYKNFAQKLKNLSKKAFFDKICANIKSSLKIQHFRVYYNITLKYVKFSLSYKSRKNVAKSNY